MKSYSASEALLIEEVTSASLKAKMATRGLGVGDLIRTIRTQLGMSQKVLANRAGVPQSTVSRIERGQSDMSVSTLHKILKALSCDLVVTPLLCDSVDTIRRKQARKVAEKQIRYLKGTMNLEDHQPDSRFIEELIKREEESLLQGPGSKLWEA